MKKLFLFFIFLQIPLCALCQSGLAKKVDSHRNNAIEQHMKKYLDRGDPNAEQLATIEVDHQINNLDDLILRDGLRFISAKDGKKFPPALKCLEHDKRILSLCIRPDFFKPAARVYFDDGHDSESKIDIFNNGNLNLKTAVKKTK
jgi:hypothetical protein